MFILFHPYKYKRVCLCMCVLTSTEGLLKQRHVLYDYVYTLFKNY